MIAGRTRQHKQQELCVCRVAAWSSPCCAYVAVDGLTATSLADAWHFMTTTGNGCDEPMTSGEHVAKFRFDAVKHYTMLGVSRVGNSAARCGGGGTSNLGWGAFANGELGDGVALTLAPKRNVHNRGRVWRCGFTERIFPNVDVGDEIELRLDLERDVFDCCVNASEWKAIASGCFKARARDGYRFACSINGSGTAVTLLL